MALVASFRFRSSNWRKAAAAFCLTAEGRRVPSDFRPQRRLRGRAGRARTARTTIRLVDSEATRHSGEALCSKETADRYATDPKYRASHVTVKPWEKATVRHC